MISGRITGLIVGMVLGIVWMWLGFGPALLTGFLAAVGWFVGGIVSGAVTGNVNLGEVWDSLQGRRGA